LSDYIAELEQDVSHWRTELAKVDTVYGQEFVQRELALVEQYLAEYRQVVRDRDLGLDQAVELQPGRRALHFRPSLVP
jgi:hypothetical protein